MSLTPIPNKFKPYRLFNESPCDWDLLLIASDFYEDSSRHHSAKALRWIAKHKPVPLKTSYAYIFYNEIYYSSPAPVESYLPQCLLTDSYKESFISQRLAYCWLLRHLTTLYKTLEI